MKVLARDKKGREGVCANFGQEGMVVPPLYPCDMILLQWCVTLSDMGLTKKMLNTYRQILVYNLRASLYLHIRSIG